MVSHCTRLLSILLGVVATTIGWIAANTKTPKVGKTITNSRYEVDINWLLNFHKLWDKHTSKHLPEDVPPVFAAAGQLATTFVQSSQDDSLSKFLQTCAAATSTKFGKINMYAKQQLFWWLQKYLGWSRPDASGFLSKASLYVASEEQLHALLKQAQATELPRTLLDIGSGTGTETDKLKNVINMDAQDVTCLEESFSMRRALKSRGFQSSTSLHELKDTTTFTHASLLNVLDRCDSPHELLSSTTKKLKPNGILFVATVLPFSSKVHVGKMFTKWGKVASRAPLAPLDLRPMPKNVAKNVTVTAPFNLQAVLFLETIVRHHPDLQLTSWTRLPYVSSGDNERTHYAMDMALMVFRLSPLGDDEKSNQQPMIADTSSTVSASANFKSSSSFMDSMSAEDGIKTMLPAECQGRKTDQIYTWLANTLNSKRMDATMSWGDVLDAGAGFGSMCWLMRQKYRSIIEITAANHGTYGAEEMRSALSKSNSHNVEIVLGNWKEQDFMKERQFDVVVADYLLGATEFHWAYGADKMMDHLLRVLRPGGYLLIVGLEPYEMVLDRKSGSRDRLVLDIEAIGDTAAMLAGESTYRELPLEWVRHQVERTKGEFRVVSTKQFGMQLTPKSLRNQLAFAKRMANQIEYSKLKSAYLQRIGNLEVELGKWSGATHRRNLNYAMVVQREV